MVGLLDKPCSRREFLFMLATAGLGILNMKHIFALKFNDKFAKKEEVETEILTALNNRGLDCGIDNNLNLVYEKDKYCKWIKVAEIKANQVKIKLNTQSKLSEWELKVNGKRKVFKGSETTMNVKLNKFDKIEVTIKKMNKGQVKVKDIILYYGN